MNLYIKVEEGIPVDHPMLEDNIKDAYPEVDLQNLPSWLMPFERTPIPTYGPYEVFTHTTYQIDNGVCRDLHHIRQLSDIEKHQLQLRIKTSWASGGAIQYPSWIWNEELCSYTPPLPYPNDGGKYIWDEASLSWVVMNY